MIPPSCGFFFAAFRYLEKAHSQDKGVTAMTWVDFCCKQKLVHYPPIRSHRRGTAPTKTENPSGQIQSCEVCWTQEELDIFRGLGVLNEKRESTYLAAFLSCWLCDFALPETGDGSFVQRLLGRLALWPRVARLA